MACKIPAILYDVPGLRDFNKSGINSILIVEDYELLAETIVNIAADKKEMIDVSERAELFVNNLFNMQNNAHKIYELYL
jgi:glycosyltransferase involved in cell wall biosynthesis